MKCKQSPEIIKLDGNKENNVIALKKQTETELQILRVKPLAIENPNKLKQLQSEVEENK